MDLFECAVCLHDMVDRTPRILPCIHTFCTECLSQLINNRKVQCPTCREVTELKTNDVKELKINFMLGQVREREKKQAKAHNEEAKSSCDSKKPICQVCQQTSALFKCKDCPQLLCESCKTRHGDIQEFKDHSVFELCVRHQEGITHLCKQCVRPLCMKCMIMEHTGHKEHFIRYDQGIKELQMKVKTLQQNIQVKISKMEEGVSKNKAKHQEANDLKQGLLEQKEKYQRKIQQAQDLIQTVEDQEDTYKEIQKEYTENIEECNVAVTSLNGLITNESGFCERYHKLVKQAERLSELVVSCQYTIPPYVLAESSSGELVKEMKTEHKVKNLKIAKKVLNIEKSEEINCRYHAASLGIDALFPTGMKPYHVIRVDLKGRVMARYYPENTEKSVLGVDVYEDYIYIAQPREITVITQKQYEERHVYRLENRNITKLLVKNKSTFFMSEFTTGKIYMYNTENNQVSVIVEGLNGPSFMNMMYTADGYNYIVTEEKKHCIKVYNNKWEPIYSIRSPEPVKSQFNTFMSTAITDMGTILIADRSNHRISHYSVNGQFLSDVVTKDDGLSYPVGICYKHPYLWVCRWNAEHLMCFKIKETE